MGGRSRGGGGCAPFIDLNEVVAQGCEKLGPEKVEAFFADERTHTTPAWTDFNAACVVAGLRGLEGAWKKIP